ncbi:MAG: hypothetical protein KBD78_09050 [Oligoflexales bacterium]|nr:hypothetical protein [Oligoflexales bacterium]
MHSNQSRNDYHVDVYSFKLLGKGLGLGQVNYKKDKIETSKYPDYFIERPNPLDLKAKRNSFKTLTDYWKNKVNYHNDVNLRALNKVLKKTFSKLLAVLVDVLVISLSLLFWFASYVLVESYPNFPEFKYQNFVLEVSDLLSLRSGVIILGVAIAVLFAYRTIMLKAAGATFGQAILKRFAQNN